jgi:hypothetical protein
MGGLLLLGACSVEPGSEKWCQQKAQQSKTEWSSSDAIIYARNCLIEGTAVGSKAWCEEMAEKPKGDWTANDTKSYAQHCVI